MPVAALIGVPIAIAIVVVLIVVFAAGTPRAAFDGGSFTDVERALQTDGLHVCDTSPGQVLADQAVAARRYDVAFDCQSGLHAQVLVDQFTSRSDRDTAVQRFAVLARPRGSGVAYTYDAFAIYVPGQSADRVQDRINTVLRRIGAR